MGAASVALLLLMTINSEPGSLMPASSAAAPVPAPVIVSVSKPPAPLKVPLARPRKLWYALAATEHGAAALDAWSTRTALRNGARERNPLVRPFSRSDSLYPVMQVMPTAMDYVGLRMARSSHHWARKWWWVPQTASVAISLSCSVGNLRAIAKQR